MRLLVGAIGAVGLILLTAFVAARLLRARTAGISIRMQIFLALAGIVGAFALGLGLLVLDRIQARATTLAEEAARDEAESIAAVIGGELEAQGTLTDVGNKLAVVRARGTAALHVTLFDPSGHVIFSSGPSPDEPGTVSVTATIEARGTSAGSVRVVKTTLVIERVLADFAPTILIISLVLGAAAAAAAAVIGRAIAHPIEALNEFAARVSEGERTAPPPPAQGREVQRLSRSIDSMRRQIEGRPFVETFAADLSHELKNPVAAIRASAEVLADGALAEPEEAARFVARIQEATTRIEALLNGLLNLARIEARGVESAARVDLGSLASQAAERARERGATVDYRNGGHADVRGDALWLARALDNLLDNARAHGGGGALSLAIASDDGQVTVSVENDGQVSRHVEKRLFRRFVTTRADKGGTGLGLAIVRAIAEAHSGSVECASVGPPRVCFRLRLPAA